MYLDDERDYHYQGPNGMGLADEVRPRVLQSASRPDTALVEVHSHGALSLVTTFSPTDLHGLADVVPQMLWRRRGHPYAALVLGDNDLDALIWTQRDAPPTVRAAVVLGDRTLTPTGRALHILAIPEAVP